MIEFATPIEHEVDYDHAYLYCITLTLHNKYDWRVPTQDELRNDHSLVVLPENDVLSLNIDGIMIKFTPVRDI